MIDTAEEREIVTTAVIAAPRARVFESAKERDQAVKVFGAVEGAKQTLARLGQHVMRPS